MRATTRPLLPALVMILLCVAYGGPLVSLVLSSFQPTGSLPALSSRLFTDFTTESYAYVFANGAAQALTNSAIIALGTTVLVLAVGVPAAYWLSKVRSGLSTIALLTLVFLQMIPEASAVIPLFQVLASWGLIGSFAGVILPTAGGILPFAVLLLGPFFTSVPNELYEASAVDGAGQLGQFFRMAVPLVRNGIVTIGVLTFMMGWGQFVYAINFLSDPNDYPITGLLTRFLQPYHTDWPGLMAASVVCALPIVVLYVLFQKRLAAGLSTGAVKG